LLWNLEPAIHHFHYGSDVFERTAPSVLGKRELAIVYQRLLLEGNLTTFEVHERFCEMASPDGLLDTGRRP
jgi:hypothetical protein